MCTSSAVLFKSPSHTDSKAPASLAYTAHHEAQNAGDDCSGCRQTPLLCSREAMTGIHDGWHSMMDQHVQSSSMPSTTEFASVSLPSEFCGYYHCAVSWQQRNLTTVTGRTSEHTDCMELHSTHSMTEVFKLGVCG